MSLGLAAHVLETVWPAFVKDAYDNLGALPQVASTGVIDELEGSIPCGCINFDLPRLEAGDYEMAATVQTTYPLSFLAELDAPHGVTYDGVRSAPFAKLAVFEQLSASSSWQVVDLAGYAGKHRVFSRTTRATMYAPDQHSWLPHFTEAFSQLTMAFQAARTTGEIPDSNLWATSLDAPENNPGADLTDEVNAYESGKGWDSTLTSSYVLVQQSTIFWTPRGTVQCAEIDGHAGYVGGHLVQPLGRTTFGDTLAPGSYASVQLYSARDSCVLYSQPYVYMQAMSGGPYSATGVPTS